MSKLTSIHIDLTFFIDCFDGENLSDTAKKLIDTDLSEYEAVNTLELE